jgi:hypothetical protein
VLCDRLGVIDLDQHRAGRDVLPDARTTLDCARSSAALRV